MFGKSGPGGGQRSYRDRKEKEKVLVKNSHERTKCKLHI